MNSTGFDPIDMASDAFDFVSKTFSDIIDKIPGSKWVEKWAVDVYNGPLRNFARSDIGKVALRGIAGSLSTGAMALGWALANTAGPPFGPILGIAGNAIATSLAATPGILRGERFDQALINEWGWRIQTAATIVAQKLGLTFDEWVKQYGNVALDQLRQISQNFSKQFEDAVKTIRAEALAALPANLPYGTQAASDWLTQQYRRLDPVELAKRYGMRSDAVALAKSALTREMADLTKYDPLTGKPLITTSTQASSALSSSSTAQLSRPGVTTLASSLLKGPSTMNMPSYASTSVAQQLQRGGSLSAQAVLQAPQLRPLPLLRDSNVSPGTEQKEESFFDKYKLWLLGGAGVALVGGVLYWSRKR